MGITADQVIDKLSQWNFVMQQRMVGLRRAAVFYRAINYFSKAVTGTLGVVLIGLSSVLVGGGIDPVAIGIVMLTLQAVNTFFHVSDSIIQPAIKSSACSVAQKQYDQLSREITVMIDQYSNSHSKIPQEKFLFETMNYSAREQRIIEIEPILIWFSNTTPPPLMPIPERVIDETPDISEMLLRILQMSPEELGALERFIDSQYASI